MAHYGMIVHDSEKVELYVAHYGMIVHDSENVESCTWHTMA